MLSERWKYFWYESLYHPVGLAFLLGYSLRVKGGYHVPRNGGLLVVANHQSFFDPPVVGLVVRRHLSYLARKSLFRIRPFGWLIDSLGAAPIDQDTSGAEGVKIAVSLLKSGKALLVFPEGSRTPDGTIQPLKAGVTILIRKAGVPVLPVGIAGAYQAWPIHQRVPHLAPLLLPAEPGTIAVVAGKPIMQETLLALDREEMLLRLRQVLHGLHLEAERLRRKG